MPQKSKLAVSNLSDIVAKSKSVSEVLRTVGLDPTGGNFATFKRFAEAAGLDYSHFEPHYFRVATCAHRGNRTVTDPELFCANSKHSRSVARKRIISDKLLPYVCGVCNLRPTWEGKDLVLVLDHINGANDDHRLCNLRFLCPNCNSQTATFAGKNIGQPT